MTCLFRQEMYKADEESGLLPDLGSNHRYLSLAVQQRHHGTIGLNEILLMKYLNNIGLICT